MKRTSVDRLLTVLLTVLLAVVWLVGLAPNVMAQWVGLGEQVWPGYAAELRVDPQEPECDVEALQDRSSSCVDTAPAPAPEDPFAEPAPAVDPFAEPVPADPFAEPDPFAEQPPGQPTAGVNCEAVAALATQCSARWVDHESRRARLTPAVVAFRTVESWVGLIAGFPFDKHTLALLVLVGGLTTSWHRTHIALREPSTLVEHRFSEGMQVLAHLAWLLSCLADAWNQQRSAAESENGALPYLWAGGFAVLLLVHLRHALRSRWPGEFGGIARLVMVVPLYAWMSLLAAAWFLWEGHPAGQAIHLHKFVQIPSIYLGIALYIWAGMMLSKTTLAQRVFDLLLPWKLPPAVLAWCVVVLAAIPTAYSGASGIFVIAAGAVVFERLVQAGVGKRMALLATAMSGSLGVVLRPCLVVVLVAVLNKNVTTDALFGWGIWVFALTAFLFGVAMLLRNDRPFVRPPEGAAAESLQALLRLAPAVLITVAVVAFYAVVLGTAVTEHTAAWVLPGVLAAIVLRERWSGGLADLVGAVTEATGEAAHHIGALLFVMVGSVGVAGVVERSEVLALLPTQFSSPWIAMTFLVVVMVFVGMAMDALGAVILVSVSLAHVAEANGIDPVHFWMMVLCAFELGYLTPPVALNHLLARQVIGEEAHVERLPAGSFWERYEHIWVPMAVMGTALAVVAYGPLLFRG